MASRTIRGPCAAHWRGRCRRSRWVVGRSGRTRTPYGLGAGRSWSPWPSSSSRPPTGRQRWRHHRWCYCCLDGGGSVDEWRSASTESCARRCIGRIVSDGIPRSTSLVGSLRLPDQESWRRCRNTDAELRRNINTIQYKITVFLERL